MKKLLNWIKTNKLTAILIVAIIYLLFRGSGSPGVMQRASFVGTSNYVDDYEYSEEVMMDSAPMMSKGGLSAPAPARDSATSINIQERKVVTESHMSLLVKDVRESADKIQNQVKAVGGFVVNTYIHSPEEGSSGYITIRVPADTLETTLDTLRGYAVKVVSENISGHDITDRYMDVEARLTTLQKTKTMFEEILTKATDVDEILRVQQRILSVQDQIDSLKGQLKYMDATTATTLVTINLATDELALPYSPGAPWRPSVVFKYAVRSLIINLRSLGSTAIWLTVYAVIWVPALVIFLVVRKVIKKKKTGQEK